MGNLVNTLQREKSCLVNWRRLCKERIWVSRLEKSVVQSSRVSDCGVVGWCVKVVLGLFLGD
jgi:hypothetical protein